tara:strand:+ start:9191 stop:13576 length:4386 start_codon:yes stop_codon:yes gene_type:complete
MQNITSNRRLLGALGLGSVVAIGAAFWIPEPVRSIAKPIIIGLVIVLVLFIGIQFLVQWMRRKKQSQFDAGVAAKEGIDDRKREWEQWTEELSRQGIDRYDLPFYLLVGEPQSGKSVLLQNSDLHFPFGQTRLSGIGGTRGCDWWFTEEAVVLDLAGRLFTHEGGQSDEAEWEAFLDLLSNFRPMCPANGIMLVIPCDGLLTDSPDALTRKASRIQGALLTLTGKLQAQLPVYVILTKADRIFGFAETVHRMESDQRHQMFGWSREAEHYDDPMDLIEIRAGFDAMAERASVLRDSMLASARLPEAQGEVDRMYGFPEELRGLYPSLEVYLKRIFSESTLIDHVFFRGLYLTSGLQSGAPIANVCAELIGGPGEADRRDLEGLFTRQQAYFIKDLVRRRVFSERGLVRPTRGRVSRARRNAWAGYGVSALIAAITVIWCIAYLVKQAGTERVSKFDSAIVAAEELDRNAGSNAILGALDEIHTAVLADESALEGMGGRNQSMAKLYRAVFDLQLIPELRRKAEQELRAAVTSLNDPRTTQRFSDLQRATRRAILLLNDIELGSSRDVADLKSLFDAPDLAAFEAQWKIRSGDEHAGHPIQPSPAKSPVDGSLSGDLQAVVTLFEGGLFDRAITPGDPLQADGFAGLGISWIELSSSHKKLSNLDLTKQASDKTVTAAANTYAAAYRHLRDPGNKQVLRITEDTPYEIPLHLVASALQEGLHQSMWRDFYAAYRPSVLEAGWRRYQDNIQSKYQAVTGDALGLAARAATYDPARPNDPENPKEAKTVRSDDTRLTAIQNDAWSRVCQENVLPPTAATKDIGGMLREAIANHLPDRSTTADSEAELSAVERILASKILVLSADHLEKLASETDDQLFVAHLGQAEAPDTTGRSPEARVFLHLAELANQLESPKWHSRSSQAFQPWLAALQPRLKTCIQADAQIWVGPEERAADPAVAAAFSRRTDDTGFNRDAGRAWSEYLSQLEVVLDSAWGAYENQRKAEASNGSATPQLIVAIGTHLQTVGALGVEDAQHRKWLDGDVANLLEAHLTKQLTNFDKKTNWDLGSHFSQVKSWLDGGTLKSWEKSVEGADDDREYGLLIDNDDNPPLVPMLKAIRSAPGLGSSGPGAGSKVGLAAVAARFEVFLGWSKPLRRSYEDSHWVDTVDKLIDRIAGEDHQDWDRMYEIERAEKALAVRVLEDAKNAPATFAEQAAKELLNDIKAEVLGDLRAAYLRDVVTLTDQNSSFLDMLVEPKSPCLKGIKGQVFNKGLKDVLAPKSGAYDQLRAKFLLIPDGENRKIAAIRPTGTTDDTWVFDRFLEELQAYVWRVPGKGLEDQDAAVSFVKVGTNSIWALPGGFHEFQTSYCGGNEADFVSKIKTINLTWKFDCLEGLKFVISDSDGLQSNVVGGLAPMLLVWEFGTKVEGSEKLYEVKIPFGRNTEGVEMHATMNVDVGNLPRRPTVLPK